MTEPNATDRIDDVAPGDLVYVNRGAGEQPFKVVHVDAREATHLLTFETDDGDMFDVDFPAGSQVRRSLESKWESAQSPTPHDAT